MLPLNWNVLNFCVISFDRHSLQHYLLAHLWYVFRDVDVFDVLRLYLLHWHQNNSLLVVDVGLLIGMIGHPSLCWPRLVVPNDVAIHVMHCRRWVALLVLRVDIVHRLRRINIIGWVVI